MTINGTTHYLWRAVDQHGNVLDILVQSRRNAVVANHISLMRQHMTWGFHENASPQILV